MRETRRLFVCALGLLCFPTLGKASLDSDIDNVLHDKMLAKSEVGIEIAHLGSTASDTQIIYRHEALTPRTPASNLKLATTSAALDRLGPDFKFRTILAMHGNDLYLWGDGDPTLGDAELLKKVGWESTTVFRNWAGLLKKAGVISVTRVLVDDGVFDQAFYHPDWPKNQYAHRYSAEVAGVNFNANCMDVAVQAKGGRVTYTLDPQTQYVTVKNSCIAGGEHHVILTREPDNNDLLMSGHVSSSESYSITIHDPALYAAQTLADVLSANGIKVAASASRQLGAKAAYEKGTVTDKEAWKIIGIHETPLSVVLGRANKDSMNLYAECLCKRLGYETTHASGSWENGTAAVATFLKKVGAEPAEFKLDDGCGLSKQNAISPNAIVHILMYNYFGPNHDTFMNSLAVAGVDGTFEGRFKGDLHGRVFGKSGYVVGVSALSGFLHAKNGQWYAFSILMNHAPNGSNSTMKELQERIIKALDADTRL